MEVWTSCYLAVIGGTSRAAAWRAAWAAIWIPVWADVYDLTVMAINVNLGVWNDLTVMGIDEVG